MSASRSRRALQNQENEINQMGDDPAALKLIIARLHEQMEARNNSDDMQLRMAAVISERVDANQGQQFSTLAKAINKNQDSSHISECNYTSVASARIAFMKKCEDLTTGDDYKASCDAFRLKAKGIPNTMKEQTICETMSQTTWNEIVKAFTFKADKRFHQKQKKCTLERAKTRIANLTVASLEAHYTECLNDWAYIAYVYALAPAELDDMDKEDHADAFIESLPDADAELLRRKALKRRNDEQRFDLEEVYNVIYNIICARKPSVQPSNMDRIRQNRQRQLLQKRGFHAMDVSTQPEICIYFERGNCDRGNDCGFSHEQNPSRQAPDRDDHDDKRHRSDRRPCRDFQRGECTRGRSCRFFHEDRSPNDRRADTSNRRSDHRDYGRNDTRRGDHGDRRRRDDRQDQRQDSRREGEQRKRTVTCNKCGTSDHKYGPDCPNYAGCIRCDNNMHLATSCDQPCKHCNSPARVTCTKECQAFRLGRANDHNR